MHIKYYAVGNPATGRAEALQIPEKKTFSRSRPGRMYTDVICHCQIIKFETGTSHQDDSGAGPARLQ